MNNTPLFKFLQIDGAYEPLFGSSFCHLNRERPTAFELTKDCCSVERLRKTCAAVDELMFQCEQSIECLREQFFAANHLLADAAHGFFQLLYERLRIILLTRPHNLLGMGDGTRSTLSSNDNGFCLLNIPTQYCLRNIPCILV